MFSARTDPVVSEDDEEFESVSQVTGPVSFFHRIVTK